MFPAAKCWWQSQRRRKVYAFAIIKVYGVKAWEIEILPRGRRQGPKFKEFKFKGPEKRILARKWR